MHPIHRPINHRACSSSGSSPRTIENGGRQSACWAGGPPRRDGDRGRRRAHVPLEVLHVVQHKVPGRGQCRRRGRRRRPQRLRLLRPRRRRRRPQVQEGVPERVLRQLSGPLLPAVRRQQLPLQAAL
jgi:hypothetical protein